MKLFDGTIGWTIWIFFLWKNFFRNFPLCLLYHILLNFHFVNIVIWANTIRILFHPFPMKPHPMPLLIWCILTFVDPWKTILLRVPTILFLSLLTIQDIPMFIIFFKIKGFCYVALLEKQNDKIIKVLCINNGGEYSSLAFKSFCIVQKILH